MRKTRGIFLMTRLKVETITAYINPLKIGGGRVRIASNSISCIYKNYYGQTVIVSNGSEFLVTPSVDEISYDLNRSYRE